MDTNPPAEIVRYGPDLRTKQQIDLAATYHPPRPDQVPRYEFVRALIGATCHAISQMAPPSRELSLALTSLEQAGFWANAAIARHEPTAELADDA